MDLAFSRDMILACLAADFILLTRGNSLQSFVSSLHRDFDLSNLTGSCGVCMQRDAMQERASELLLVMRHVCKSPAAREYDEIQY